MDYEYNQNGKWSDLDVFLPGVHQKETDTQKGN